MKIKNTLIILTVLCALLLSGCIADDDISVSDESETAAKSDTASESVSALKNELYKEYLPERLADMEDEKFEAYFEKSGAFSTLLHPILCNTPEKVYFSYVSKETGEGGIYVWSKKSGKIVSACPDPLCNHIDCVFESGMLSFISFYDGGLIVCRSNNKGGTVLYTTDVDGGSVKKIYETDENISGMGFSTFDKRIFFFLPFRSNDTTVYRICELKGGEAVPLSPSDKDVEQYAVTSDGIYYKYAAENELCFTSDMFETFSVCEEKVRTFYSAENHIIYCDYDQKLYCDGKYIMEYPGDNCYSNGCIYYLTTNGFELHRMNIETLKDEKVLAFRTDGIDDEFLDYIVDPLGFIYTICSTYIDVENARRPSDPQTHFAIYDVLENKKVLLDPSLK